MSNAAPMPSPDPGSGPDAGEPLARVLVIDDSTTILKVVSIILERNGYEAVAAADGRAGLEALRERGPFDLVLLDFVMPRMNGYQFCRELRSDETHKNMPIVLMSARTNAIGERFVEQTGAVDALGKPFDARALVAVVGAVLAKGADPHAKSMPSPDTMVDEEELDAPPESVGPPSEYLRSVSGVSATLARALAPHLEGTSPQKLQEAIDKAVDTQTLLELVSSLDELDLRDTTEVLRGSTSRLPLAEILQTLQLRRQNGVMTVRHKGKTMTLYIEEGTLLLAHSEGTKDEFRLGRYFVEKGWVSRDEIDKLVEEQPDDELFGEWLVEQGKIDEEQLKSALTKQSAELVYEVLRWPDAVFVLHEKDPPEEATKAQLGLGLSELALEGFRRVDEWRLMADTIDFNAVLVVDQVALGTVDDSKFAQNERPVLLAIDGQRSVREVVEAVELASFDAIKAIYRFLQSRIVREVKPKAEEASKDESEGDEQPSASGEAASPPATRPSGSAISNPGSSSSNDDDAAEDAAG